MNAVLFVNPRSGGGKATQVGLAEQARARGIDAVVLLPGDLPFVCVPAGTRNHFALDLGLDRSDVVGGP